MGGGGGVATVAREIKALSRNKGIINVFPMIKNDVILIPLKNTSQVGSETS